MKKTISKKYQATTGLQNFTHWPDNVATDRTAIDTLIEKDFYWTTKIQRGKRRSFESPHGEWAETEAHVSAQGLDQVSWDLFPLTGKPHQLRFELARRGFPIHGDKLYGSKVILSAPGISLRAVELNLANVTNKLGLPTKISVGLLK